MRIFALVLPFTTVKCDPIACRAKGFDDPECTPALPYCFKNECGRPHCYSNAECSKYPNTQCGRLEGSIVCICKDGFSDNGDAGYADNGGCVENGGDDGGEDGGVKKCLPGWGTDVDNCYPQAATLECSSTGFTLTGLTKSIMYETVDALQSDKTYGINANGENVGSFDENGDVTIEQDWDDVKDLTVTHSDDGKLKFQVEISAESPALTIGDITIHTTRTDKFSIICSYSDSVQITLDGDSFDVNVGNELGSNGLIDDEPSDIWSSTFDLNVYSDDEYTTKITSDEPISLGSPVYSLIGATGLPTALQYYVSDCEVKASDDENEKTKITIFQNYECYNPIFGDAQSIFMGRSIKAGSTTDYKFRFPAFTFNTAENDQLYMVSSILFYCSKFLF